MGQLEEDKVALLYLAVDNVQTPGLKIGFRADSISCQVIEGRIALQRFAHHFAPANPVIVGIEDGGITNQEDVGLIILILRSADISACLGQRTHTIRRIPDKCLDVVIDPLRGHLFVKGLPCSVICQGKGLFACRRRRIAVILLGNHHKFMVAVGGIERFQTNGCCLARLQQTHVLAVAVHHSYRIEEQAAVTG